MSSSHLLLGLRFSLLVLYFKLSSGLHSAAFTNHQMLFSAPVSISFFF